MLGGGGALMVAAAYGAGLVGTASLLGNVLGVTAAAGLIVATLGAGALVARLVHHLRP